MLRLLRRRYRWFRPALPIMFVLLSGCGDVSPVPPARMPELSRREVSDASLLESLRRDWSALKELNMPETQRQELIRHYNAALLTLLQRCRADFHRQGRMPQPFCLPSGIRAVQYSAGDGIPLHEIYDDIVPAAEIPADSLEEHYTVPGVGVPMVGVIPAEKVNRFESAHTFPTRGTVRNLTALLEFPSAGQPILRFIPRNRHETVDIGRLRYQLAANFSAAIELYWDLTQVDKGRFLGLLHPQKLRDVTGLTCMTGYNPDKIPVILTHGLLSSAGTFENLVNRLTNDPVIRNRYQFWFFNYPTGVSWTVTAEQYRRALTEIRRKVDPHHRNRNWDRMVVVGHSMGGLITHYSQCTEPWLMLSRESSLQDMRPYLSEYYVDHKLPDEPLNALRGNYFFRPVQAGMVIYLATPHQGAPLARYRIVRALMSLVELPQGLVNELINIATLQEDMLVLNPQMLTEWFTSVNQLSPDSYSIRGLKGLQVRQVPTYSVIGNRGCSPDAESSDGVVPYWSSHIPWGEQKVVSWDHSVQDSPDTADYLRDILCRYAQQYGDGRKSGK